MGSGNDYMQVPGIPGDATDTAHAAWIEILDLEVKTQKEERPILGQPPPPPPDKNTAKVRKLPDSASQPLRDHIGQQFDSILVDSVSSRGTRRITLERATLRSMNPILGETHFSEELEFVIENVTQTNDPNATAPFGPEPA